MKYNPNDAAVGRREFLGRLCALGVPVVTGLTLSRAFAQTGGGTPAGEFVTVRTRYGRLRGRRTGGVAAFQGVPYGGPVSGEGRFKPPPPLKPWDGVRDALEYGAQAIQPPDPNMHLKNPPQFSGAEDCLFLNIWTPATDGRRRPVMFYCHGGGFTTGDGGGIHHGTDLSEHYDVVVVTVNHRLGLLGYLSLADLAGGEYADSGNAGMLDIVAALRWVHDNIEAFGGDPHNVMIWGESGGGAKVSTLLAMPPAHGLFHKASIESGPGLRMTPREAAAETAKAVLAELGLSAGQVHELTTVPVGRLVDAQNAVARRPGVFGGAFAPVVDGRGLPRHPFDPTAPPISAKIPLLIGTNKDEAVFFLMNDPSAFSLDAEGLRKRLLPTLGDKTDTVISAYRRSRPAASPSDLFVAITTAQIFWRNTITLAERKVAQHGAPVFMYLFAYQSEATANPAKVPMRAMHAIEIPFKFDHPQEWAAATGQRPERFRVAANMSRAWATFARTGHPGHDGIPKWPAYTLDRRATMVLDAECRVVEDPFREERLVWREIA